MEHGDGNVQLLHILCCNSATSFYIGLPTVVAVRSFFTFSLLAI